MRGLHRSVIGAALYGLLSTPVLANLTAEADAEVQYLLNFVTESGCVFIRNGSDSNSVDAADHLRLKYRRGKRYVNSADQFIDRLASESSWSGKKYTVNCTGTISESGAWLHQALEEYRMRPQQEEPRD